MVRHLGNLKLFLFIKALLRVSSPFYNIFCYRRLILSSLILDCTFLNCAGVWLEISAAFLQLIFFAVCVNFLQNSDPFSAEFAGSTLNFKPLTPSVHIKTFLQVMSLLWFFSVIVPGFELVCSKSQYFFGTLVSCHCVSLIEDFHHVK